MKMVMFSTYNFSWNLSSDVSARCSSHPQNSIEPDGSEHLAETSEDKFQLKLKEENITISLSTDSTEKCPYKTFLVDCALIMMIIIKKDLT